MPAEAVVEFDAAVQSLTALNAAAYRLAGVAACQVGKEGARYVCRLTATGADDPDALRAQFLQLVTDENVREGLRENTEPVRNLILSLAFGSLAAQSGDKPGG